MKKYDSYQDSGIEWIGEIPSHWEVKRFKYCFCFINDKIEGDLPKIGLEHIESWTGKLIENNSDFEGDGIYFKPNDILFGKLRPYLAKVYLSKIEGKAVGDFFVFRPTEHILPNYGQLLILSKNFIEMANSSTFGSKMPRVSPEFFNELKTVIPPREEQTAIAAYLDRKTAEIDALIADKKRLLELYEEEKTALINQAVTKGIHPDVPMKDLGSDGGDLRWLGEIPAHWEVKRIRHVAQIFGRIGYRGYKTTDLVQKGEGAITISPSNMKGYYMDFSDCSYLSWEKYEESPEIMIHNGDILFVKTGSTYGKSSLVENLNEKATINPQIIVLKEIQCNNKLLWYIIKSEYTQFQVEGTVVGGTIPTISQAKINNYEFVITPDEKEQQAIVEFIDNACSLIDAKKAKTEKLIDLLTEYRTALISEVVTGKIKVTE